VIEHSGCSKSHAMKYGHLGSMDFSIDMCSRFLNHDTNASRSLPIQGFALCC
jgi:hypothetical protein